MTDGLRGIALATVTVALLTSIGSALIAFGLAQHLTRYVTPAGAYGLAGAALLAAAALIILLPRLAQWRRRRRVRRAPLAADAEARALMNTEDAYAQGRLLGTALGAQLDRHPLGSAAFCAALGFMVARDPVLRRELYRMAAGTVERR